MSEQSEQWQDKERAGKYAKQRSLASKLVYSRLAKQVVACLESSSGEQTMVDLSCGPGFLGIELGGLRPQAQIIGVDPSGEMLQIARENAALAGLQYYETRHGRAEEMPLDSGCADLVISQSSFHEWEDPQRGLAEIYRVLRPGGSLILKDYDLAWLSGWKRRLLGKLHPLHMFQFSFDEVASMVREAGFEQIHGKGKGLQYFLLATKQRG
jgi:ubiquinone/menaquinone biosynthesis C-methylase UbiE